jgi:hypothetical protein
MFCQVQGSATGWSLVQMSPTDRGASLCVIWKPREWRGPGPRGGGGRGPAEIKKPQVRDKNKKNVRQGKEPQTYSYDWDKNKTPSWQKKIRTEAGTSETSTANLSHRTASYSIRLNLNTMRSRNVAISCHVSHLAGHH